MSVRIHPTGLRPLPAARRVTTPPLTGPGNGFEFLKEALSLVGEGSDLRVLVGGLRSMRPQWREMRAKHYLDRIRSGLQVIEGRGAWIRPTETGRALQRTGNPDTLREWLLTSLLGFDHLLVWMSEAQCEKKWLLQELRRVNPRWFDDNYPRSLLNWTLWLGLTTDRCSVFTLTERGRAWRAKIQWAPEYLRPRDSG